MASGKKRVQAPSGTPPGRRASRRTLLLAGGGAAVVVVVLVAVSVLSSSGKDSQPPLVTTAETSGLAGDPNLLDGIPQHGLVLGSPKAPVTMVEYADLQCPYCAEFATGTLPTLLDEYVRPGKVKIEFRGLAFVGDDSRKALRVVLAAAEQNRAWNVIDLLFANQGEENKGWVTDDLLRRVGGAIAGLDGAKMLSNADKPLHEEQMREMDREAQTDGVRGTPTFTVARAGVPPGQISLASLDAAAFRPALDAALTP
jgi:protein-disulfide isomerase